MDTSSKYRQLPHLLIKCMLLACCLLLTGCDLLPDWFCQKKGGDPHYPSTVLLVDKKDVNDAAKTARFIFKWEDIRIGDDPLSKLLPKPIYWRLSVFSREDPTKNAIDDSGFLEYREPASWEFKKIPLDYLMTADLDLIVEGTPKDPRKVYPLSFAILLHKFPETDLKTTMEQTK